VSATSGYFDYSLPFEAAAIRMDEANPAASSDEALMARFAASLDDPSFTELARRYADRAYRVARALLGEHEAATDAVQESFLRVVRARATFREAERFDRWYFGILRNLCRDETRRKRPLHLTLPDTPDSARTPGQNAQFSEESERALAALARLPDPEREALTLRLRADLDFAGVAAACGISTEAAKKRVYRGLEKIRKDLR